MTLLRRKLRFGAAFLMSGIGLGMLWQSARRKIDKAHVDKANMMAAMSD